MAALPLSHSQAAQIIKTEWSKLWNREPSKFETLFMLAVAWLETHYSRFPGQHLDMVNRGLYNWANVEKTITGDSCPEGWEPGKDWEQYGGTKKVCFRVFKSDNEAASELIRQLTKRHWPVIQAIESSATAKSVAHAMKTGFDGKIGTNGMYYTGDENAYANGLDSAVKNIGIGLAKDNGITPASYTKAIEPDSGIGTAIGIGIVGIVSAFAYNEYRKT